MNNYEKCLKLLTSKEKFHIELGLDRVGKVLEFLGNPQDKIKTVHVAGTNGKGSTCAILSSVLKEAGYKVGLFTSPHLVKYNERIKINSLAISDDDLYNILVEIDLFIKKNNIYLTEFEILTVAGFLYFARNNVDVAVIEVGLGGRLDSTNVIKKPAVCAITSISLDHVDRLGNTIEQIAFEKAGIVKNGAFCCVTETNDGLNTIKQVVKDKNAIFIEVPVFVHTKIVNGINYAVFKDKEYEFALNGKYQEENLSLALSVLDVLEKQGFQLNDNAIKNGLKNVSHGGRLEIIKELNLVIDGAHNPSGALALRNSLDNLFPQKNIDFIYSTISTKDYSAVLNFLLKKNDEVKLLRFNHPSAIKPEELIPLIKNNSVEVIEKSRLESVILANKKKDTITVLTGSLYAIGEVYKDIEKLKIAQLGNIQ